VECCTFGEQCPDDAYVLVRQRNSSDILITPHYQFAQPAFWFSFVFGKADDCTRPVDQ